MTLPTPSFLLSLVAVTALAWTLAHHPTFEARAAGAAVSELKCRTFEHPLEGEQLIETSDRTSEIGQWVAQERSNGWVLGELDFEVTQKQNGFPMGFVQVCVARKI